LGTGAPKGVLKLPYSTLLAAWPALHNPAGKNNVAPLTRKQFHWCFTNSLSREESDKVYDRYYIPGSARPFFQAGLANFNPKAVTKVDYSNSNRPPLLLITGEEDRICPPSVNKANWKKQSHAPPRPSTRSTRGAATSRGRQVGKRSPTMRSRGRLTTRSSRRPRPRDRSADHRRSSWPRCGGRCGWRRPR
jgi:hypothetical protein